MSEDEIHIEQLELEATVGVPDAERATPQRLVFNITITPQNSFRQLGDDLQRTVDYAAVRDAVKEFVRGRSFKLIETLADELASRLKQQFAISRVAIEVRKFILPDTKYVAVRAVR